MEATGTRHALLGTFIFGVLDETTAEEYHHK